MSLIKKKKNFKKKNLVVEKIREIIFGPSGLPIFVSFAVMALLFVLFRLKSIELEYKIAEKVKEIQKAEQESKDINAAKARLLSVRNLRRLAEVHGFSEPKGSQIIVVP